MKKNNSNYKYTLDGIKGNTWVISSYVRRAMLKNGFPIEEINKYKEDSKKVPYDSLMEISESIITKINNHPDLKI